MPDREGKHSPKLTDTFRAKFLVEVNDDLGVGLGPEHMPLGQHSLAQFLEVVDLAIKHNPDRFIFVGHRLRACVKVDNCQPAVPQPDVSV